MSFQFQLNKKERVMCNFKMDFKSSFCWHSTDLSNDDIISAYARQKLVFFGLKLGQDLENRGLATQYPHQGFPCVSRGRRWLAKLDCFFFYPL